MTGKGASAFAVLQRVGRSLMMPIAVLPAAGLLFRFGQPDMLGADGLGGAWPWLLPVAQVLAAAGGALFDNLPVLFAIGVAIGFARKADGSTALAALTGYLVFDRVSKTLFFEAGGGGRLRPGGRRHRSGRRPGRHPRPGRPEPHRRPRRHHHRDHGRLLWERFYRIKLPSWLAFFGGRRFVPIITAVAALLLGVLFGLLWRPVADWLAIAGDWLSVHGTVGAGIYGVANRLLIPLGLHHVLNTIVWFTLPECRAGVDEAIRNAAGRPELLLRRRARAPASS